MNLRIVAALIVALVLAASHWKVYTAGEKSVQSHWDAERTESARLVRQQQDANRDTARAAEVRYVDRETVRTQTITVIEKELRNEAQNLDACRLDAGDISLLQRAAACAREDRPASCGAGEQVPTAR